MKSRLVGTSARVIGLEGGVGMAPLSEAVLREIQRNLGEAAAPPPLSDSFEFLSAPVESWVRSLSKGATLAYVETEYFGGEGFQRAVVWRDGEIVLGPLDGAGSVNKALKALGVEAGPGQEEFDFVGLGRHRTVEEWLSES